MFTVYCFLKRNSTRSPKTRVTAPDCFKDLNLNQIVQPILKSREQNPNSTALSSSNTSLYGTRHDIIAYRQEIMRELAGVIISSSLIHQLVSHIGILYEPENIDKKCEKRSSSNRFTMMRIGHHSKGAVALTMSSTYPSEIRKPMQGIVMNAVPLFRGARRGLSEMPGRVQTTSSRHLQDFDAHVKRLRDRAFNGGKIACLSKTGQNPVYANL